MTRQDHIFKWFVYTLGLVPVWVLDAYILVRYPLQGVRPTLLPLAVVVVAVLEGSFAGAGFGLGVGLLWALGYPDVSSIMVLGMTLTGMLTGMVAQYALTQGFLGCLICSAAALGVLESLRVLAALFIQLAPPQVLLELAVREFLYSMLWTPLVYLIFRAVFRRVGQNRLA